MSLALENLDDTTRQYMLDEFERDVADECLYYSKWFTERGEQEYPQLCRSAITTGSDDSLVAGLEAPGLFVERYEKKTPRGGITTAAVPHTAPTTFAEGEFNRYYLRGLCARLIAEGGGQIEIYRARSSTQARTASEALIGSILDPAALLADLRANIGVDTALGLPD